MKPWIILIVLAVTLTAAFTVAMPLIGTDSTRGPSFPAPAKPDGPAPVADVLEDPVYDFGKLPQQYVGHHSWTFKNSGAGPLELRGASTTCSCTTADLFKDATPGGAGKDGKTVILKPGETFPVEVTFRTKTFDHFHQSISVVSNDPSRPSINLAIEGEVRPAILTIPADPTVVFGHVGNDVENRRNIAIYSPDRPDMILTKVTSTNPALLSVSTKPMDPEESAKHKIGKATLIEVTLKPSGHLGAFNEELLIETDHPQKSDMKIGIVGTITGPITVIPDRVTVRGATTEGGTEFLKIVVRNRTAVNFTVEKQPGALDLAIDPLTSPAGSKGSLYKMVVKVKPGSEPGRIVDEIVLKTDHPDAVELKIPVNVLITGSR